MSELYVFRHKNAYYHGNRLPLAKSEREPGTILITKNQRAHNIWIIDAIRIAKTTKAKQNCLRNAFLDRVGVKGNLIYITEKYLFNAALRNVAIIVSRKGFSKNAQMAALGCLKESGKLIIDLTDEDLIQMLHKKIDGEEAADFLLWKLGCMLMSVGK